MGGTRRSGENVVERVRDSGDGAGGGRFIGKFIPVEFLGRPTMFPIGAPTLAIKTGSQLLPMFTIMEGDNTYKTVIHKPINLSDQHKDHAIFVITAEFVRIMEDYVYRFPYLWHFWDEWETRVYTRDTKANMMKKNSKKK
jgi:lauroyl/myristoyl acyltransferase